MATVNIPPFYATEDGLKALARFLRSDKGIKNKTAVEYEKRVEYFKGKRFVECILLNKFWPKSLPAIDDHSTALHVAQELLTKDYFHRSEKVKEKKGVLLYSDKKIFEESGYYTWMYSGSSTWMNIGLGGVVVLVVGFTLLPIWPEFMKKILWYISVTFLLVTFTFILVRFLGFLVSWIIGREFWIFPRLFDETLTVYDSFRPVYSFEKCAPGQGYYRMGLLSIMVYFFYWAYTQPTEFDGFLQAQKSFVDDLYSGNLLADVAHDHKSTIDRTMKGKVPDLEDLLRQVQEDEKLSDTAANDNGNAQSDVDSAAKDSANLEEKGRLEEDESNDARLDDLLNEVDEEGRRDDL